MPAQAAPLNQEAAQLYGPNGQDLIADTEDHTGDWHEIYFLEDTVFNAFRGEGMTGTYTGVTFPQFATIKNALGFKFIDLTSGSLIAYRR